MGPVSVASAVRWAWNTDLTYGMQLDIVFIVQRLAEHFAAAALSLECSRSFYAVRAVGSGILAALADAVLRQRAVDFPSDFTLALRNDNAKEPFGPSVDLFARQCETLEILDPEVAVAKTLVLDYFLELAIPERNEIWSFEKTRYRMNPERSTSRFTTAIGEPLCCRPSVFSMTGQDPQVVRTWPEYAAYRDINYWFKYFLCASNSLLPTRPGSYASHQARLIWKYDSSENALIVEALHIGELMCNVRHSGGFLESGHRWPSQATPSVHLDGAEIRTEDDILHVQSLPDFDGALTQRDAELLLSYLTVPYLRIPLVLNFFASEDRVHALRNATLRDIVTSVVFEPGRYLSSMLSPDKITPTEVPTTSPELLGTTHGLLMNELCRSPEQLIAVVLRLLQQALDLDTGSVYAGTRDVALFIVRMVARLEGVMRFLYTTDLHVRGLGVGPAARNATAAGLQRLGEFLRTPSTGAGEVSARTMLHGWLAQVQARIPSVSLSSGGGGDRGGENGSGTMTTRELDEQTRLACDLQAHLLLLYVGADTSELSKGDVLEIMNTYTYLSVKHTWNCGYLGIPETELFHLMHKLRPRLIAWMEQARGPGVPQEKRQDFVDVLQVGWGGARTFSLPPYSFLPSFWFAPLCRVMVLMHPTYYTFHLTHNVSPAYVERLQIWNW